MTGQGPDYATLYLPGTVTLRQASSPTTLGGWGERLRHNTDTTTGLWRGLEMAFHYVNVLARCECCNFRENSYLSPTCELSNLTLSSKNSQNAAKASQENREKEVAETILLWSPCSLEAQDTRRRAHAMADGSCVSHGQRSPECVRSLW